MPGKRVRYIDMVASAVSLQNRVDMMRTLQEMHALAHRACVSFLALSCPPKGRVVSSLSTASHRHRLM